jgi:hypothetical protein
MALETERTYVWKFIIGAVALLFFWLAVRDTYRDQAWQRVDHVLDAMKKGSNADGYEQEGIAYFARGVKMLGAAEYSDASNAYDRWRKQRGFQGRKIARYAIVEARRDGEVDGRKAAVVTVMIEYQTYRIRVIQGLPLEWDLGEA